MHICLKIRLALCILVYLTLLVLDSATTYNLSSCGVKQECLEPHRITITDINLNIN
jgi:hypothetical protein